MSAPTCWLLKEEGSLPAGGPARGGGETAARSWGASPGLRLHRLPRAGGLAGLPAPRRSPSHRARSHLTVRGLSQPQTGAKGRTPDPRVGAQDLS